VTRNVSLAIDGARALRRPRPPHRQTPRHRCRGPRRLVRLLLLRPWPAKRWRSGLAGHLDRAAASRERGRGEWRDLASTVLRPLKTATARFPFDSAAPRSGQALDSLRSLAVTPHAGVTRLPRHAAAYGFASSALQISRFPWRPLRALRFKPLRQSGCIARRRPYHSFCNRPYPRSKRRR